ncbi:hypothetical protein EVAR_64396_1 [Eumeta japonica]|uniref:Uncharacterized protein n=1 Tax=Eumeta variegata TaxID=151549 RepID=A0A4C1SM01_EUMVA|nr:hypothetical protein EVAR_64396_1 [Eumeta japonica]
MAADPVEVPCEPFEQIGQDQETPTLVGAEESEAETEVIHQNVVHLGAHIKRINHLTLRSLCSALTEWLEYVQRKAALEQSHSSVCTGTIQLFSASTHRWAIMLKHLEKGDERKQDSSLVLKKKLFDDYETKANETDTQYSDENQRVRKGKDITMTELQKKLCSEEKRS